MKIHEKIKEIRTEKRLKLTELHRRITSIFGNNALTYRTLQRIEGGHTDGKASSLYQICLGLGITLRDLQEGIEHDPAHVELQKRKDLHGRYIYSSSAYAEIRTGPKLAFLALELVLYPKGKTKLEQDPADEKQFKKWIYVLKGSVTCTINERTYTLSKGDSLAFDSCFPHILSNETSSESRCIVIQNPRHF